MTYNTLDRFRGIWLGSILGSAVVRHNISRTTELPDCSQDWLKQRQQATVVLWKNEGLQIDEPPEPLAKCKVNLLSVLPWIVFYGEEPERLREVIEGANLSSMDSKPRADTKEDILIWSCLLTLLFRHESGVRIDLERLGATVVGNARAEQSSLAAKLATAITAVKEGTSLHQLRATIATNSNLQQTAIALAFYCFVTTPSEFWLSINRAARLDSTLGWLTVLLTGTLSGAYNGMAGIPHKLRIVARENSTYRWESQLAEKLFQAWSGVYSMQESLKTHPSELDTIAAPQLIQPRRALKIVSQRSELHNQESQIIH